MRMDMDKAIEFIETKDRFLLSTHVNPDGDGIGSILGLTGILKKLGKKYSIILQDPPQDKLSFLPRIDEIRVYDESMVGELSFDSAVVIDSPSLDRIGEPARLLSKDADVLNIDHHVSNRRFGSCNLIAPEAAASTQIIGGIFESMGIKPDKDSAQALYVGLCVDTGRFRFNNTTPEVFRMAARFLEAGAVPDEVADWLYYDRNPETLEGLVKVISSIELYMDGRVAAAHMDYEFLNSDAGKAMDTEGFVNYPLSINGVEVVFLIQEYEKGKTRLSLRSKTEFDVNKLAKRFGGGGHFKASGCRIEGDVQSVKIKVLDAIEELI